MDKGTKFNAFEKETGRPHRGNPLTATGIHTQYINCMDKDNFMCSIRFDTWKIRDLVLGVIR